MIDAIAVEKKSNHCNLITLAGDVKWYKTSNSKENDFTCYKHMRMCCTLHEMFNCCLI